MFKPYNSFLIYYKDLEPRDHRVLKVYEIYWSRTSKENGCYWSDEGCYFWAMALRSGRIVRLVHHGSSSSWKVYINENWAIIKLPWLVANFQGYSLQFKFIFSDIDLVVLGKWATLPLETLAASLREKQVAAPDTLEVRGKAKVFLLNSFYLS